MRVRRQILKIAAIVGTMAAVTAGFATSALAAAPSDQSCNGAFNGTPEGSLAVAATRDGEPLANGAQIEAGDVVTVTATWDTDEWLGDELDKILTCFELNDDRLEGLEEQEKPTDNDGSFTDEFTVPADVEAGDALCVRARLSGDPAARPESEEFFPSTQKSNILCFEVAELVSPGTIVIEKQTLPDGAEGRFEFTGDVTGTLSDGETLEAERAPGTYTVTEQVPEEGWELTKVACDDDDSTGDVAEATATIVVAEGETVTCVFTNAVVDTLGGTTGGTTGGTGGTEGTGGTDGDTGTDGDAGTQVLPRRLAKTGVNWPLATAGLGTLVTGLVIAIGASRRAAAPSNVRELPRRR